MDRRLISALDTVKHTVGLSGLRDKWYDAYRMHFRPRTRIGGAIILSDRRLTPVMRHLLYGREYEQPELAILQDTLEPGDRVLELGTGLGLLSIVCAQVLGSDAVTTFEANPELEPIIRANYAANAVHPELIMAMVGRAAGSAAFHIRKNCWASSAHDARRDDSRTVTVPVRALDDELRRTRANYLIVDIEGGEDGLFDDTTLPDVSRLLIEVHPDVIGADGVARVLTRLRALGFKLDSQISSSREMFLRRQGVSTQ